MDRVPASRLAIGAAAILALMLRVAGLGGVESAVTAPTGYDDGVYYSASALTVRGSVPYRDFVFVHPPGIILALSPIAWVGAADAGFAASRYLSAFIGVANSVLAGAVAAQIAGGLAGGVAAFLYAIYPDAVIAERSPYLEPLLNLFCLLSALLWLRNDDAGQARRSWFAGLLTGAGCAVKLWGGSWVLAAIASPPRSNGGKHGLRLAAGGIAAGLLLVGPFLVLAPRQLFDQVLGFQLSRPPDGVGSLAERLDQIFRSGHGATSLLAAVGVLMTIGAVSTKRRTSRGERYFAVAHLMTLAGFVASSSYWSSYNAHLAAGQTVLAGLAAARIALLLPKPQAGAAAISLALIVAHAGEVRDLWRNARVRAPELQAVREAVRSTVPGNASLFAFDPTWALAGGRLPDSGAAPVVDSYGAMLMDAVQAGPKFSSTAEAFKAAGPQQPMKARLAASHYVILGPRGREQLTDANLAWFRSNFLCITPRAGELCVWERLSKALPNELAVTTGQPARFGTGWFDEEGSDGRKWRWMSKASEVALPSGEGRQRLQIEMYAPVVRGARATVRAAIDERELGPLTAAGDAAIGSWTIEAQPGRGHTLRLTADRTFVPADDGKSADRRALSASLERLIWLPASEGWLRPRASRPAAGGSTSSSN